MATLSLKETFRLARLKMGLSQNQLAEKLGVVNTTIRNYEKGRREPEPLIIWNFSNIAPSEFRQALRAFVPENFRRSVEQFVLDSNVLLKGAGFSASGRYSAETVAQLHQALDIILDRAPSETVQELSRFLEKQGGMWGEHPVRPRSSGESYFVPPEVHRELEWIAVERKELDTAVILLSVLRSGIHAEKLKIRGERQAESDREGQTRVHRGKKAK